ncbi:Membrane metallo-endopeptidase-like 1 [Folsomia candida]|uniref:Membrane metallo-endopeptidase-like 1 n=1 Tax=Folsomia candida TaxID=158441 RepID=A0A226E2N2_FOLCA|nr:Membrane metallo-endopeptidase-like 1 [Folsomia candida]
MNLSAIREEGQTQINQLLDEMGGWPVTMGAKWTPTISVESLIGRIRSELNMGILIELWIGPDDKNSSNNIIQVDQMQLGLPSRDYFLNGTREQRAYQMYMTELSVLFNASFDFAFQEFQDVLAFETALANVSIPEADRQDTSAIYRKDSIAFLQQEIPDFNWTQYFQTFVHTELGPDELIVSYAFPYLKDMAAIIKQTPPRVVQNYVVWRVLMEFTAYLVDKFQDTKIEFRQVLMGVTSERHRWHQCVEWTNKKLGMALGALFIRDNFDPTAKETAQEMIGNIRDAFIELLEETHWMDEETRKVAKEKALFMNERIGYPDFLTKPHDLNKEYLNLRVSRVEFVKNILEMGRWKAEQNFQKLRKPVEKDKWSTEPAVVNAFYDPNKNDIVFPAGILQPLFYSQHFPKSLNYGGIGVVIGHEITHGFDDKGRQFDSEGNLKEWWNNETIGAFREQQTACIIDQYSAYRIDSHRINGRMTQGENIADSGGLKQAYRAFKKWERRHGVEPLLPGLEWMTQDQYFFLNYAQIWCGSMRPEDLLSKIRSAVHAPAPIRVLGPLSNSNDFAKAYSCPAGSPMNPKRKCSVW